MIYNDRTILHTETNYIYKIFNLSLVIFLKSSSMWNSYNNSFLLFYLENDILFKFSPIFISIMSNTFEHYLKQWWIPFKVHHTIRCNCLMNIGTDKTFWISSAIYPFILRIENCHKILLYCISALGQGNGV